MNLSSVIVQVKRENLQQVIMEINDSQNFEYHFHDETGRIIVTIEGANTEEEIKKLEELKAVPHVMSAEMVFAYSEDELEQARDKLEKIKDNIPDWLNNPNTELRDIKYGGDLKGKL